MSSNESSLGKFSGEVMRNYKFMNIIRSQRLVNLSNKKSVLRENDIPKSQEDSLAGFKLITFDCGLRRRAL